MMKSKFKFIIIALVLLIGVFGVSYAFYEFYNVGGNNQLIVGNIYLKLNDGTDTIDLTNIFPETKEEARARNDNQVTFTISGLNTTTDNDIYYEIMLNEGDSISGKTRAKAENLVFDLIEIDENGKETMLVDAKRFVDINARRIWVNTVSRNVTTEINRTYKLRMWLSEDVLISDTNPDADYTTDVFANSYASVRVSVFGDFVEKEVSLYMSEEIEINLSNYLSEPDADGTKFLVGSNTDVNSNYVWYSGKLWRIVSINNDGSIKLVTQGNMTGINWNISSSVPDYSVSQVNSWLNNEFLPTLANIDTLLATSVWDYTTYPNFPDNKLTTSVNVTEIVGMLNIYEYMKTGGSTSSTTNNTFLNNGYRWWTVSPKDDYENVWYIEGCAGYTNSLGGLGVRPAINLKSGVLISSGNGTKTNPYVIKGDKEYGVTSELLNNRISGEYVNFNNTLYRIVGVEDVNGKMLTKVTMADYSKNKNTIGSVAFGADSTQKVYSTTYGIGLYLEEWYQADSTSETYATTYIDDVYKNMIATASVDGITWYTGPTSGVTDQNADYTLSKTGNPVSATIGLGYYGEIFSTHFGSGPSSSMNTWLLTIEGESNVWYIFTYGDPSPVMNNVSYSYGVRPSFYLKSNVKIVSGTGMPHDPYEISQ